ncbi:MAG: hypothetical protein WDO13_06210 [Verrucomicrobiota bacterium]
MLQAVNDNFQNSYEGLARHTLRILGNRADIFGTGPWTTQGSGLTISPATRSVDPYFPNLGLFGVQVSNARGGYAYADLEYRGLSPVYGGSPPGPIYSLDRSTSNEPIQTHPKWKTAIAGTPGSPLNCAVFYDSQHNAWNPNGNGVADPNFSNTTAAFYGWGYYSNGSPSIFAGVDDYLVAGQTWTATYVTFSPPDFDGVGLIDTPDGSPDTPSGFVWIYIGGRFTDQAGVYRVDESWRLYPPAPPRRSSTTLDSYACRIDLPGGLHRGPPQ